MTKPGKNALFYMDFNNRWTGKDATKPCALGLLGHSNYTADGSANTYLSTTHLHTSKNLHDLHTGLT